MSAFGLWEKDNLIDAIEVLAAYEAALGQSQSDVIRSILEVVTYGIDKHLKNLEVK